MVDVCHDGDIPEIHAAIVAVQCTDRENERHPSLEVQQVRRPQTQEEVLPQQAALQALPACVLHQVRKAERNGSARQGADEGVQTAQKVLSRFGRIARSTLACPPLERLLDNVDLTDVSVAVGRFRSWRTSSSAARPSRRSACLHDASTRSTELRTTGYDDDSELPVTGACAMKPSRARRDAKVHRDVCCAIRRSNVGVTATAELTHVVLAWAERQSAADDMVARARAALIARGWQTPTLREIDVGVPVTRTSPR